MDSNQLKIISKAYDLAVKEFHQDIDPMGNILKK